MSEMAIGHLTVRQNELGSLDLQSANFDLAISTVSWESRATAQIERIRRLGTTPVALLRFESGPGPVSASKDRVQAEFEANLSAAKVITLMPSSKSAENFKAIEGLFSEASAKAKRPMRVLIDMSCVPKRYILFIVGLLFRREHASLVELLYSEGRYLLPKEDTSSVATLISVGDWSSVQVPYMEGSNYVPLDRDLVVSVGGEVTAVVPLVERIEPHDLRLIKIQNDKSRFPGPLSAPEQKALKALTKHPGAMSAQFANEDAIGVAAHVLSTLQRQRATTCLAVGSKPHALGLGLAGLAEDSIEICCRTPASYTDMDVSHTGRTFSYLLRDRFDPRAYLP